MGRSGSGSEGWKKRMGEVGVVQGGYLEGRIPDVASLRFVVETTRNSKVKQGIVTIDRCCSCWMIQRVE